MASYRVEVADEARKEVRRLPGNMRQRVIRALRALQQDPRPGDSQALDVGSDPVELQPGTDLRRIRLASWRVVYLIEDEAQLVTVIAIRKRPPYQYNDLEELLKRV